MSWLEAVGLEWHCAGWWLADLSWLRPVDVPLRPGWTLTNILLQKSSNFIQKQALVGLAVSLDEDICLFFQPPCSKTDVMADNDTSPSSPSMTRLSLYWPRWWTGFTRKSPECLRMFSGVSSLLLKELWRFIVLLLSLEHVQSFCRVAPTSWTQLIKEFLWDAR